MSDFFPLSIGADRVRPITPEYGLLRGECWTTVPLPPPSRSIKPAIYGHFLEQTGSRPTFKPPRHDHDQKATQLVGDVAEAAVLSARYTDHVKWLQHERVLAPIAPGDLKTAGEAEKVLDCIEMAVQTGSVAGLALGNAHDQPTRALHRPSGAATLVIRRRHHRIDAPRRHLFHRARRNVVRLEILTLVGLQLVEADAEAICEAVRRSHLWKLRFPRHKLA